MFNRGFAHSLTPAAAEELSARALRSRGVALTATTVAASGHPGGSLSSMELYTVLLGCARLRPDRPQWDGRDRIVVSHGHTSPGLYAALGEAGFFDPAEVEAHFRQAGSIFEGHIEHSVPGVEWSTGNLGQGLSAGIGMALAARVTGHAWHTFVVMSDGEQNKGQIAEARRLAVSEGLSDVTVLIDCNGIQISGRTAEVMPVNIKAGFEADGWGVIEVDGHDIAALHSAISQAVSDSGRPVAILARTRIGWPVSFMLDDEEYHGRGLTDEEYERAMAQLGLPSRLAVAKTRRDCALEVSEVSHHVAPPDLAAGPPREYSPDDLTDNRSAWGAALLDIAEANPDVPMLVFDCDLAASVKTAAFASRFPRRFVQCGVGEHNAATAAGAASASGTLVFWADFGVFGIDEAYNQQRLNDINGAALKLVLTHCGVDVGEDGRTHHCLDYIGLLRNMFGWRVIVPADPNETDRAIRWMARVPGNVAIAMGRSRLPVICDREGTPLFGGLREFEYGRMTPARKGAAACILVAGTPCGEAVLAADKLREEGFDIAVECVSSPLDLDDLGMERALATPLLVTVEDHHVRTGLGGSVAEWLALRGHARALIRIGHGAYKSSGPARDLFATAGMSAEGIARTVRDALGKR
ncbi:MAG: transketolase [Clostridiales bacterium]|nr:transketolase [Clostridiales bacterium]